jgi:CHAT domain-containing protein
LTARKILISARPSASRPSISSDTRLADEAISLSAGFQLAGYRQAIATLWPAADLVAARVAHDVYSALTAAAVDSAAPALHQAVRRRRDAVIDRPSAWAAYVHNGV